MTSQDIHKLAELSSLKIDLQSAFEDKQAVLAGTWVCQIDPENMDLLKNIMNIVDGLYSINKLAFAILKGKKIILYTDKAV